MKLTFFLIGFCLIVLRFYYSYSNHGFGGHDGSTLVIKSDNFYEELKYDGKIVLTDDESGIRSISPGGYFKYTKNEKELVAKSDLKGEISYSLYEGHTKMPMDENGQKLIQEAIGELLANGFDADKRADLLFRKGGAAALLKQLDSLRSEPAKLTYLDRVFATDSLSPAEEAMLAQKIGQDIDVDNDKFRMLSKIKTSSLKDSMVLVPYLAAVETINSDMEKEKALTNALDSTIIKDETISRLLAITEGLNAEDSKNRLYSRMIEKGIIHHAANKPWLEAVAELNNDNLKKNLLIHFINHDTLSTDAWNGFLDVLEHMNADGEIENVLKLVVTKTDQSGFPFDRLLTLVAGINNDDIRKSIIKKIIEWQPMDEYRWERVINAIPSIDGDGEKADILIQVARKMPKTERLHIAYVKAAKSINSDSDFGRAIKEAE